jgi:hypothetical protein
MQPAICRCGDVNIQNLINSVQYIIIIIIICLLVSFRVNLTLLTVN